MISDHQPRRPSIEENHFADPTTKNRSGSISSINSSDVSSSDDEKDKKTKRERKHRIRRHFDSPRVDRFSAMTGDSFSDDESIPRTTGEKARKPTHLVFTQPSTQTPDMQKNRSSSSVPFLKKTPLTNEEKEQRKEDSQNNSSKKMEEPVNPTNPLNILQNVVTDSQIKQGTKDTPFDKILNFRDLAEADPLRMKPGKIFRSGLIHMANEHDFEILVKRYGIKTTIDLRSSDEIKQHPNPLYEKYFPSNRANLGKGRCRAHLPLWKVTMNFKILIEAKKYRTVAQIAKAFATGERELGIKLLLGEMNIIKLPGMYKCFLKYVQDEIRQALEICSNPKCQPVLIHCSLGKDRTGVMSALVSDMIGIPRKNIIEEYSKSEHNLFPFRDEMIANLKRYYFEEWLAQSPVEVMEETFEYIDKTYGSLDGFLNTIGLNRTYRIQMRSSLLEEKAQ